VIGQHSPVTASEVARHLLSVTHAERARIRRLESRDLVSRQYTGLRDGEHVGFLLTDAGREALDRLDRDPSEDQDQ